MDLSYFSALLRERERVSRFRQAITAVVGAGDRVLDVGAGLGTYAFFAAAAGADRVWAVDGDPAILLAREIARENGLADRVDCRRGRIPEVRLPARADVVIYEDFSPRLLDARVWRLYRDLQRDYAHAATRWIPAAATLYLALLETPDATAVPTPDVYGVDWGAAVPYLANLPHRQFEPGDALSAPAAAGRVDFAAPVSTWPLAGAAPLTVARDGTARALALWFALDLGGGACLSNAPGSPTASWGHIVLPLERALPVAAGDTADGAVRWDRDPDGVPAWLAWSVRAGAGEAGGHEFAGFPASREDLLAASADGRPADTDRLRFARQVLALTDGARTVDQIAMILAGQYPSLDHERLRQRVQAVLSGLDAFQPSGGEFP